MQELKWRPRRSILFAIWGGGEHGSVGSTEWIEEHLETLRKRSVGYINADLCSGGSDVEAKSSDLLKDVVRQAIRLTPDPFDDQVKVIVTKKCDFYLDLKLFTLLLVITSYALC